MASFFRCFRLSSKEQEDKPVPFLVPSSVSENLNLGIDVVGGKMSVLISKMAEFPVKAEKTFETSKDYQTWIDIGVYEGKNAFIKDNIRIGGFRLDGFPPAPKGIANFKLCFEVDANGTLKATAVDTISGKLMKEITIPSDQRRAAKILNAKSTFLNYATAIMQTLVDARYQEKLKFADKKKILELAKKQVEWLEQNEAAKIYEYESRQKELEALWNPIVTKLYKDAVGRPSPMLNKAETDSCTPDLKAAGKPSPFPNEVKPESCSSAPLKAGSVLDVVD